MMMMILCFTTPVLMIPTALYTHTHTYTHLHIYNITYIHNIHKQSRYTVLLSAVYLSFICPYWHILILSLVLTYSDDVYGNS